MRHGTVKHDEVVVVVMAAAALVLLLLVVVVVMVSTLACVAVCVYAWLVLSRGGFE